MNTNNDNNNNLGSQWGAGLNSNEKNVFTHILTNNKSNNKKEAQDKQKIWGAGIPTQTGKKKSKNQLDMYDEFLVSNSNKDDNNNNNNNNNEMNMLQSTIGFTFNKKRKLEKSQQSFDKFASVREEINTITSTVVSKFNIPPALAVIFLICKDLPIKSTATILRWISMTNDRTNCVLDIISNNYIHPEAVHELIARPGPMLGSDINIIIYKTGMTFYEFFSQKQFDIVKTFNSTTYPDLLQPPQNNSPFYQNENQIGQVIDYIKRIDSSQQPSSKRLKSSKKPKVSDTVQLIKDRLNITSTQDVLNKLSGK